MFQHSKNKLDFLNNDITLSLDYENKKYIKDNVLPKSYFPYQLDMWEDNKFYGLVNQRNKLVVPDERYFDTINIGNRNIRTFLFIKKAFEDMKSYTSDFQVLNRFTNDLSNFSRLEPKNGYINLNLNYIDYINKVFKIYGNEYVPNNQFTNFDEYMNGVIRFITIMCKTAPITRSGFVISPVCDPKISGLILSLEENIDHRDDFKKYVDYYQNPNLEVIFDFTKRFGFVIDRNAPWRLVADINSPVMKKYMNTFGITNKENLFDKAFNEINDSELDSFKNIILSFYNYYAASRPTVNRQDFRCSAVVDNTIYLPQLDLKFIQEKYNDSFFIRLYIYTRCLETNLLLNQQQFENIVNTANQLYKFSSTSAMMNYLDSIFILQEQNRKTEEVLTTQNNLGRIVSQLNEKPLQSSFVF